MKQPTTHLLTLFLLPFALALPTPEDSVNQVEQGTNTPATVGNVNAGIPRCKTQGLSDFCLSNSNKPYCDATGFHNNMMAQCEKNCWCE
ncbi:uncharacterized protein PODANS_6_6470 [Podospora anserina S mat+]|uniref:Podospora anserina S mat+ genomic DNA chromosome 6, supercontig 2 n=2 Tax=Podospora TaxID=5144 RepID=B2B3K2_PODAN|nr:uncharacterized protein PODANS_6_6470 [Podospora anserina S mat+]KAK4651887.1 hypothetical protein QC762_606470 [Podospora pseudocomata]CAP71688.1 unnamed protein product [Podospora anserina S mat+]CDP31079.1 Putative protein of unknown function [Podospora anserina S mat+]